MLIVIFDKLFLMLFEFILHTQLVFVFGKENFLNLYWNYLLLHSHLMHEFKGGFLWVYIRVVAFFCCDSLCDVTHLSLVDRLSLLNT